MKIENELVTLDTAWNRMKCGLATGMTYNRKHHYDYDKYLDRVVSKDTGSSYKKDRMVEDKSWRLF